MNDRLNKERFTSDVYSTHNPGLVYATEPLSQALLNYDGA